MDAGRSVGASALQIGPQVRSSVSYKRMPSESEKVTWVSRNEGFLSVLVQS